MLILPVNKVKLTPGMAHFHVFSLHFLTIIYSMAGERQDCLGDRYDLEQMSTKARKSKKTSKSLKKKVQKTAVEKVATHDAEFPANDKDFKLFYSLEKHRESTLRLLGIDLIRCAPEVKTVVGSGAFEDFTEVRSNKLTEEQLEDQRCDHEEADTRLFLHAMKSTKQRVVLYSNDADVLISGLEHHSLMEKKKLSCTEEEGIM